MDESAVTVRYAKAIFSLAKQNDLLASLKTDMELISNVCRQSVDFDLLLKSPVVKSSEKIRLTKLIFGEKIDSLSLDFLELVMRNKREAFIPFICRNVLTLIRKEKNIKTAVLTTVSDMDEATIRKAEKILETELGSKVELSTKVNPRMIGGVILRIDDRQYDASIATQLKKMKQELLKTRLG
ncbi:ATP synthase F1 subunit delta [Mariniphaga sediminis]|uniref:ATP synthase subunit delta n=1 Tax=Mariniphaga sediminis TaxID=1628158 RepID=A0A399CZV8_9BACT|nr:ATP synthase F1 subunit delta [Mariniphaga sediminis]RIH64032.1 ATP synthase F1 subunit delta [Mariniphaga sediminis]